MRRITDVLVLACLWCLLGGWIGALLLFSAVVAPAAFRTLPGPEAAGRLVGPVLQSLNVYGVAAGLALGILGRMLRRGWVMTAIPLIMSALALLSQLGVTAAIERIRPLAFGPEPDPAALARFGQLHGLSVLLFGAVGLLALLLAWLHAEAEVRARGRA